MQLDLSDDELAGCSVYGPEFSKPTLNPPQASPHGI
jgi:hypothetical protein